MEYQKTINLLDNPTSSPSKPGAKYWVGIIYHARGTHNTNSQIKCKLQY